MDKAIINKYPVYVLSHHEYSSYVYTYVYSPVYKIVDQKILYALYLQVIADEPVRIEYDKFKYTKINYYKLNLPDHILDLLVAKNENKFLVYFNFTVKPFDTIKDTDINVYKTRQDKINDLLGY